MKKFDIPDFYKSPIIGRVKQLRKSWDPKKKDFEPLELDRIPREIVHRLVRASDVVIDNFGLGVMENLGFGVEARDAEDAR